MKRRGYFLRDLPTGNYSLRLKATSLAQTGNWTAAYYFIVPDGNICFNIYFEYAKYILPCLITSPCPSLNLSSWKSIGIFHMGDDFCEFHRFLSRRWFGNICVQKSSTRQRLECHIGQSRVSSNRL